MDTTELLKKVRKIEIKTRGLSNQIFAGEYHSAFKGKGMTFSEVREYQYGDPIKGIDWNVTARFNHPFVKIFEEEREMTVMLLVDVSASKMFGTHMQLKRDLITEVAAVLSFSAIANNDKIGVIFFSDQVERYIPPQKGKKHILRIIRDLIEFTPEHKGTNISEALRFYTNVIKKRSTGFILSDFIDQDFNTALKIANNKHDVIALRVFDRHEKSLPDVGLIQGLDAETGQKKWIDTSSKEVRNAYNNWWKKYTEELQTVFSKNGVDAIDLETGRDYVRSLITLFKHRS
ncbi:MAG: DUF58 domain-containing protein [Bacteroidales bacterium]|nr:DUF58 domain-containing protein [Bacteroidales bacterium]